MALRRRRRRNQAPPTPSPTDVELGRFTAATDAEVQLNAEVQEMYDRVSPELDRVLNYLSQGGRQRVSLDVRYRPRTGWYYGNKLFILIMSTSDFKGARIFFASQIGQRRGDRLRDFLLQIYGPSGYGYAVRGDSKKNRRNRDNYEISVTSQ